MYFGSKTDPATSRALLDQYAGEGGTFIDTANIYSRWVPGFNGGESETLLGAWMKERGNRESLFVASKVGFEYPGVERGLSAKQIEGECEKSLKRLGIETIDLYYAHVDDRTTPQEESLAAFDRLVHSGKVRYIGASNFLAWRLAEADAISRAKQLAGYCCIQQRYTYLRPRVGTSFKPQIAANDDLLDYCGTKGVTILAYSPLLSGAYTRFDRSVPDEYLGADGEKRLQRLNSLARELEVTPNQLVLAWMMNSNPAVIPVMAGSTAEQLRENMAAAEVELTAEQVRMLNDE
jgi:aryl-alcohol dehydrogenase-like predicted oxidoreductase